MFTVKQLTNLFYTKRQSKLVTKGLFFIVVKLFNQKGLGEWHRNEKRTLKFYFFHRVRFAVNILSRKFDLIPGKSLE